VERARQPVELEKHDAQPFGKLVARLGVLVRGETGAALLFLAPAVIALFAFRILPAGWSLATSFSKPISGGGISFVGLDNYVFLLRSPGFVASVVTTIVFNLVINPVQIMLALALAVLLSQRLPGVGIWRVLVFLPTAVPLAITSIVWGVAFRPEGPINAVLAHFGIRGQSFLTSSDQALASIIILASWAGVGYWMIFLIAGLQEIPEECLEAAAVDGAGWWRTFFSITLPMLRRPLAFVLVADTVANFILFAPVQILTKGGPLDSTNLLMFDVYKQAYVYGDLSLATAEVVVLVLIMLSIVTLEFRLLRQR
jgi:multiple sugar transport system permease protein